MMLAANISTARFIDDNKIPGIYRIHEEPFEDNIRALQRFLFNFGASKSMAGGKLQKRITRSLQAFEGKPEAQVLNILTLRSMQQAKYSAHNVGHFGLGFSHYTHFTSPIRRYPDLIAHRLIKSVLYSQYRKYAMDESDLETAATMLSACEQRSVKAERQLIAIKKARFIKQFEGETFVGLISSVTKFGVFVSLREYDVDGLVKIEALGDDRFIFDEENLRLVGKRTGIAYVIGDTVEVEVVSADTEAGKVEFRLSGENLVRAPSRDNRKNRKDVQKRGKAPNDRRSVRKERVSKRRRKT
jgi:ribonuclease R